MLYQFYSGYSAGTVFDITFMYYFITKRIFVNTLFSALPVGFMGAFDQDIEGETAMSMPQLYSIGIQRQSLTWYGFLLHSFEAVYHACVIYFLTISAFSDIELLPTGELSDYTGISIIMTLYTMWVMDLSVVMNSNKITAISFAGLLLSLFFTIIYTVTFSAIPNSVGAGILSPIFSSVHFWMTFLLIAVVCAIPRMVISYTRRQFKPTDTQIAQEIEAVQRKYKRVGLEPVTNTFSHSPTKSFEPGSRGQIGLDGTRRGSIKSARDALFSSPSLLSPDRSTLEVTDIHHTRESFFIPQDTISLILPGERRHSLAATTDLETILMQRVTSLS